MPPTTESELRRGLRAVAARLDEATASADVVASAHRGPAAPPWTRALLAAAAVVALLVGLTALLVTDGQDESVRTDVSSSSASTDPPPTTEPDAPPTTPPPPVAPPSYEGAPWEELPDRGLAVVDDGRVALLDLAGAELGSFAAGDLPGVGNGLAAPLLVRAGPTVQLGEPGVGEADGCVSTGRGGVRVAVCGAEQEALVRLSPSGEATPLVGRPLGAVVGRWRVAEPSPDGRWVLGTFSVECEVPFAVLVPAEGGEPRTADGFTHLGAEEPPFAASSYSVGWTDAGQAVVVFSGDDACGTAEEAPGTYLVDPDSGARTLLRPGSPDRVLRWERVGPENDLERAFSRAASELGLETCCGEPAHGGGGLTSGVVWEGRSIPVSAVPLDGAPRAPLTTPTAVEVVGVTVGSGQRQGSDALAFTCGDALWVLGADGTWAGAREVLRDLAAALIPRLSCTAGPPPGLPGG